MASAAGKAGSETLRAVAEACKKKEWSKAIRIITSLPETANSPVLLCNRAWCYSKLELNKHVIKDCDKAIALNPSILQAYLYKGQALAALNKQEEACQVWQTGYESALGLPEELPFVVQLHSLAMGNPTTELASKSSAEEEELSFNTSGSGSFGSSRKSSKVSAVTITESESESMEHIYGGSRSRQSRLSVTVDIKLSKGIQQVNRGNYEEAVSIFNSILTETPNSCGALLGRGTAYAFMRKLKKAIADFSKAIEVDPKTAEAWKRRGQARAAIGETAEALEDLSKAIKLEPTPDLLHERGVVNFKLKNFFAAIEDLRGCLAQDADNKHAHNYLGLALTASGSYVNGIKAQCRAVELDDNFKEGWVHLAQSYKELADAEKAVDCLKKAIAIDDKYGNAYRLWGILLYSLGEHRNSSKMLTTASELEVDTLECLYLRGSCFQALGEFSDAVKDYDSILDMDFDTSENRTLQILAFYQRENALYTVTKLAQPFGRFDMDGDLSPIYKEAWCKRLPPDFYYHSYKPQPVLKEMSKGSLRQQDTALTKSKKALLDAADAIGRLIQYNSPGFMQNARQQRMAGFAAIEIAQKVSYTWRTMNENWDEHFKIKEKVVPEKVGRKNKKKSSNGRSANKGGQENNDGMDPFMSSWRDVYSIAVKWRQISEPCDSVVWVDKLSEKEFAAGFGSHTPMVLGQAQVVRYYPNFERAFKIVKDLIHEKGYVNDAANRLVNMKDPGKLRAVDAAKDCSDLFKVIGRDFWVVTPCNSTHEEGKVLDGTRLTLQKQGTKGFDFSIRTPGTPPRWADYDAEMAAAWQALCDAYCNKAYGSLELSELEHVRDCILRLSFYWYNFMPLARGTAVVGYVTLLGLFLAANMKVTVPIPKDLQVDWEAILAPGLDTFNEAVKPWLYSGTVIDMEWQTLPDVSSTFSTTGAVIGALSLQEW
ncbi:hypothetical protein KC19_9G169700 [Ceratodon purpureus]|uniref:Suppressor of RPS4-RLD 1 n=1 Tax=Ceratodon purpureus TaxID=3225 RepID=A0A8T0GV33_CERPU|nr:hypothetical protein KC19_9G169700 [Ceratodon purpureus]